MSTLKPQQTRNTFTYFRKNESLFNGTLGKWEIPPVNLYLKYDATPVCSRPYPVPRVHDAMFRKEVERLVKLGVIKEVNDS